MTREAVGTGQVMTHKGPWQALNATYFDTRVVGNGMARAW